ncbi:PREDICTED: major pollen allergen Car b 1-like [Tarenaya hassleriana]|uniref:major pollen allergen Car b 1-like n=1 Tax=Tarenaya hassleriana TaxID=28532 RepID=UPI00053C1311|nr:PREDICTED: major pollen allergen Car b 1-like [Tarenaya hassleriana]
MGIITRESETASSIPPARLFKAIVLESHTLMPKILPQAIKSIQVHGDGGAGTTFTTIFAPGFPYKNSKSRVESLDVENLEYKYSVVEGDPLNDKCEKITTELKFLQGTDGGSVIKIKTDFYSISSSGAADLNDEEMEEAREKGLAGFKAVEAYLLANPSVCN